jgi:peptidoglycan hydrolase-like protein with peptidoglycan-binding domain
VILLLAVSTVACRKEGGQQEVTLAGLGPELELDPAKQKAIWDAEHVTFEFEHYFGRAFLAAWENKDREALLSHFKQDVVASYPPPAALSRQSQAGVEEESWKSGSGQDPQTDVAGLVDFLVRLLTPFDKLDERRLRVTQISKQDGGENRWDAEIMITIRGKAADGQAAIHESVHDVEFSFAREEDLATERVLRRWGVKSLSNRASRQPLFREVTSEVELDQVPIPDNWKLEPHRAFHYRFQMAVEDYDLDGYPDVAVSTYDGAPLLLKNIRGRRFVDVALQFQLKNWAEAARKPPPDKLVNNVVGWVDYNNDGYPDLLMGPYFYRNQEGTGFVDVTRESGLRFRRDPMGMAVVDYDGDGFLDLYLYYEVAEHVTGEATALSWIGDDKSGAENQLWHNEGDGTFRDVTAESGTSAGKRKTTAVNWLFLDEDHLPDLYLVNDFGLNVMLRNQGDGTFEDISEKTGTSDYSTSMGVATGDLDNDGYPEIYIANMFSKMGRRIIAQVEKDDYPGNIHDQIKGSCAGNRLYRRVGEDVPWQELSLRMGINRVGWAYSPAMFDLDGDGWLDIYASTGYMSFDRRKPDG